MNVQTDVRWWSGTGEPWRPEYLRHHVHGADPPMATLELYELGLTITSDSPGMLRALAAALQRAAGDLERAQRAADTRTGAGLPK